MPSSPLPPIPAKPAPEPAAGAPAPGVPPDYPPLAELVGVGVLQVLQDRLAALGSVSIWLCNDAGEPLTTPSWGHDFARLLGRSASVQAEIEARIRQLVCEAHGAPSSVCFEGSALYPAAIRYREQLLGVLVVGPRPTTGFDESAVRRLADQYDLDAAALRTAAQEVEPWSESARQATYRLADALADTIAQLYGQAREIQVQLADLRSLFGLTELLAGTHELDEILALTTRNVVDLLGVKACAIRLLDEDTGELVVRGVFNLSEEYLDKGPVHPDANSIDQAALAGETVYIEDAPSDPRFRYRAEAEREGIVSGLCAPMTYRGRTIGVIRVYTDHPYRFSDTEGSLIRAIGSQAAAAIVHSRLYAERARAARAQRQLAQAGEIQRRMLPAELPRRVGMEFGCVYVPTLAVGGDFYDLMELPGGHLGICVADVMGKGLPAALMMASVRSALRTQAYWNYDLDETIIRVNQHLCRDTLPGEFTTLFYGVITPDGKRLTYCNAGHDPPLLLRGDKFIELTVGGMVIGVDPASKYDRQVLTSEPGDILVLTTDGVPTALDFAAEAYGRDRLRASIRRHRSLAAPQLAKQLLWDVRRFTGLTEQADDITLVVVKFGV